MMTPKEALIKDGRIPVKEGRGRLSREAVARLHELVREGWQISGYSVEAKADVPKAEAKVVKAANTGEKVISEIHYTYPENEWKALDADGKVLGGKYMGMREVCSNCRVSLVAHNCESPRILGNKPVFLVRR